jgi:predicted alternative tryptophan synthase beta-subunit
VRNAVHVPDMSPDGRGICEGRVILFGLSGHGHFDLSAYAYLAEAPALA